MLEWCVEEIGKGNGATTIFSGRTRHQPVEYRGEHGSVIVSNESVIDVLAHTARCVDATTRTEPGTEPKNGGVLSTGYVWSDFPTPPKVGESVFVVYAWEPSRLRNAQVRVLVGGQEEWVSIDELRDAIVRT